MKEYPDFTSEKQWASIHPNQWTIQEAREYKDWLLKTADMRIEFMLQFLGTPRVSNKEKHLEEVGKKASTLLTKEEFSYQSDDGGQLTNKGYALAADIGLLIAHYLFEDYGHLLRWRIIRRPKSDPSYNMPVIDGIPTTMGYLIDPIHISIVEAYTVLNHNGSSNNWRDIYKNCVNAIEQHISTTS